MAHRQEGVYRANRGFTLVEVIIVVLILSIVAVAVVPKFTNAASDARETALASNLAMLRRQIEIYKCEHLGRGPQLKEDGKPDPAKFVPRLTSRTDVTGKLNPAGECGPYMMEWPANPYAKASEAEKIKFGGDPVPPRDDSTGWYFSVTAETIHINTSEGIN